jgi:hypothetical protein
MAAAEAEEEDAVSRPPHPYDCSVAVDDVGGDPEPGRLAGEVIEPSVRPGSRKCASKAAGTQAGIVERQLIGWVDRRIRTMSQSTGDSRLVNT